MMLATSYLMLFLYNNNNWWDAFGSLYNDDKLCQSRWKKNSISEKKKNGNFFSKKKKKFHSLIVYTRQMNE